jgi:hypothetical protein
MANDYVLAHEMLEQWLQDEPEVTVFAKPG